MSESRFSRAPSRAVLVVLGVALLALAALVVAVILTNRPATGDPGRLSEIEPALPGDVALPQFSDASVEWGVAGIEIATGNDQMAGGAATADLDGDGDDDLIVANGDVVVLLWNGSGYDAPRTLLVRDAIAINAADVDRDGHVDLLVSRASDADAIVWGGSWAGEDTTPKIDELLAAGPTSGLLVGELTGDDHLDIVRLGRGFDEPFPDILWVGSPVDPRLFTQQQLPVPDRFTLAGELVDVDGDGLLDIWLTRDVGWSRGGDTVLSRQGNPEGEWVDIAPSLGVGLEIDGMGITVADLNGDRELDAYVSDLGDNEQLYGTGSGFRAVYDTGAAHIRPVGGAEQTVSSTWGSGALDANLDGVLDLVLASGGFPIGTVRNKIDGTSVAVSEPPSILLGIGGGAFVDVWPQLGLDLDVAARGLAVGDLDGDGDSDVVIVERLGGVHILRNDTTGATITVRSDGSCPYLGGAVVTVASASGSFQRLLSPHGYAGAHAASVSVGVNGSVSDVVVEVVWPDGAFADVDIVPNDPASGRALAWVRCR